MKGSRSLAIVVFLASCLVVSAPLAHADESLPLPVKKKLKGRRISMELPANIAEWPEPYRSQLLTHRAEVDRDMEPRLRERWAQNENRLAGAGMDLEEEEPDLSNDDPTKWPIQYRSLYVLMQGRIPEGQKELFEGVTKAVVRGLYARDQRLRALVEERLRDEPNTSPLASEMWKSFAVRLAASHLNAKRHHSEAVAVAAAIVETRHQYIPANQAWAVRQLTEAARAVGDLAMRAGGWVLHTGTSLYYAAKGVIAAVASKTPGFNGLLEQKRN